MSTDPCSHPPTSLRAWCHVSVQGDGHTLFYLGPDVNAALSSAHRLMRFPLIRRVHRVVIGWEGYREGRSNRAPRQTCGCSRQSQSPASQGLPPYTNLQTALPQPSARTPWLTANSNFHLVLKTQLLHSASFLPVQTRWTLLGLVEASQISKVWPYLLSTAGLSPERDWKAICPEDFPRSFCD